MGKPEFVGRRAGGGAGPCTAPRKRHKPRNRALSGALPALTETVVYAILTLYNYCTIGKEGCPLKKLLPLLLIFCLGTVCALSSLAWQRAGRQAEEWKKRAEAAERRAIQAETARESSETQRRLLSLENDPIDAFFAPFPYSGGTARYLAFLEAEAYRAELENAAELLRNSGSGDPIDAFLAFIDTQAQAEANAWTNSLEAQGAGTAGAWAHVTLCQIPIYRFGAYTLISAYQRTGDAYPFLFNPEDTRQALLDAGFRQEELPPAEQINK